MKKRFIALVLALVMVFMMPGVSLLAADCTNIRTWNPDSNTRIAVTYSISNNDMKYSFQAYAEKYLGSINEMSVTTYYSYTVDNGATHYHGISTEEVAWELLTDTVVLSGAKFMSVEPIFTFSGTAGTHQMAFDPLSV